MAFLLIHSRSGPDCKIHLEIPVDQSNTDFEVEVVIRPGSKTRKDAWPPGYFDLFGSINDETFARPAQGDLPKPVDLG